MRRKTSRLPGPLTSNQAMIAMTRWIRLQFPTLFSLVFVSRSCWLFRLKISAVGLAMGLVVLLVYNLSLVDRFSVSHETLVVGGETREYRLVRPLEETVGKKLPVIFAFHGALDLTDEMAVYTGLDELVEEHEVLLVYPQGRLRNWPPYIAPENPDVVDREIEYFLALCDHIAAEEAGDPSRFYLVGVSQGGAMVNLVVNFCSERVAAAVCNCGWLPSPLGDAELLTVHKCPMLFIVGENDRQVPPNVVGEARRAFAAAGHPTEWLQIPDFGHGWARDRGLNPVVWNFLEPKTLQTGSASRDDAE